MLPASSLASRATRVPSRCSAATVRACQSGTQGKSQHVAARSAATEPDPRRRYPSHRLQSHPVRSALTACSADRRCSAVSSHRRCSADRHSSHAAAVARRPPEAYFLLRATVVMCSLIRYADRVYWGARLCAGQSQCHLMFFLRVSRPVFPQIRAPVLVLVPVHRIARDTYHNHNSFFLKKQSYTTSTLYAMGENTPLARAAYI